MAEKSLLDIAKMEGLNGVLTRMVRRLDEDEDATSLWLYAAREDNDVGSDYSNRKANYRRLQTEMSKSFDGKDARVHKMLSALFNATRRARKFCTTPY